MSGTEPNLISGTIAIAVFPQENGQYFCQLSPGLSDASRPEIGCHGQTPSHAVAIALEQLADEYRDLVEEEQGLDALAVERSASGEVINKHYHVILHYEEAVEGESMFEAMHDVMIGNTVVENAKVTVVEIDPKSRCRRMNSYMNDYLVSLFYISIVIVNITGTDKLL